MNIRARFHCHTVLKSKEAETVTLQPVYSSKEGSPNHEWSQYTPSGKIEMTISNPGCWGGFVPGTEYDILFSPVPKPVDQAAS